MQKRIQLTEVVILVALLAIIAFFLGSTRKKESPTVDSLPAGKEERGVRSLEAGVPSISHETTSGKHRVSAESTAPLIYITHQNGKLETLARVQSALGVEVKPSRSGRTGSEIHFPPGTLRKHAEERLSAASIPVLGELRSFSFQSSHTHSSCATCLVPNYQNLRALPGVLEVPSFLGDKENSSISVIIDAEKVSSESIISTLERDHFSNL